MLREHCSPDNVLPTQCSLHTPYALNIQVFTYVCEGPTLHARMWKVRLWLCLTARFMFVLYYAGYHCSSLLSAYSISFTSPFCYNIFYFYALCTKRYPKNCLCCPQPPMRFRHLGCNWPFVSDWWLWATLKKKKIFKVYVVTFLKKIEEKLPLR